MNPNDWQRRATAAEKTAAVLKHKVDLLYSGTAQSQIHRQLEKARLRDERNRLRTEQLQQYSQELEAKVRDRTRAIRTILDHVSFGFLVVDRGLAIRGGFTRSCEALFGRAPEPGQSLVELLGVDGNVVAHELLLGVDQLYEDILPEEVSVAQLPGRFVCGERVLRLEASVVRSEEGEVEGILFTVGDITRLEAAEREARERDVLLTILRRKGAFEQFVSDTRAGLAVANDSEDAKLVRRVVHTIKGNAASWGLEELVAQAHEIEFLDSIDADALATLDREIRRFLEAHHDVLGVAYGDARAEFSIGADDLARLRTLLQDPSGQSDVDGWIRTVVHRPAGELLGPIDVFVEKLSERLDKTIRFEIEGAEERLDAERLRPVIAVVPHLIRNAVDHGIEPRAQRGDKPHHGRLTLTVGQDSGAWLVRVADDGGGVPYERLIARAVELGHIEETRVGDLDEQARIDLVFRDGLSTASETTDISGRGVGMSAVRSAVEAVGGAISLVSSPAGTTVELRVPQDA